MFLSIKEKSFRSTYGDRRAILKDITMQIAPGQSCAIWGPSGVGKSTLLSILAGLDAEFSGEVTGRPRPAGSMFQEPRLLPWLTARENVSLVLRKNARNPERLFNMLGLERYVDLFPDELSLGIAKSVALARALAISPRLLLLDEPFASLDPQRASRMARTLEMELQASDAIVFWTTHDRSDTRLRRDLEIALEPVDGPNERERA